MSSLRLRFVFLAGATLAALGPAHAQESVLVPARVIYPGETVQTGALKAVTVAVGRTVPVEAAVTLDDLDGKVAKRTLLPGRYIAKAALRDAYLVQKGAAVEMIFEAGALRIAASAVTLEAGGAGDVVKVRNTDSGRIVSGIVMADGTIRIGG